jgi:hypothetical protein
MLPSDTINKTNSTDRVEMYTDTINQVTKGTSSVGPVDTKGDQLAAPS